MTSTKKNNEKMIVREEIKTVFKTGNSLVVCIPPHYIKNRNIKAGDRVRIYYDNDILYVNPIKEGLNTKFELIKEILSQGQNSKN